MMAEQPDIQLLPNGDILTPVREGREYRMFRVSPEEEEYAAWLTVVQKRNREPGFGRAVRFWMAAAMVFCGVIVGIPLLILVIAALVQ
jgi:hypothetical protein